MEYLRENGSWLKVIPVHDMGSGITHVEIRVGEPSGRFHRYVFPRANALRYLQEELTEILGFWE